MQQRRSGSSSGRPSGTDGFDFSYRMVVDSRYTKVATFKSRLSRVILVQGLIVLAGFVPILSPVLKVEDADVLSLSSAIISFFSLIIGDSGRRHSRGTFLKIYLFLSSVGILLSLACVVESNFFMEIIQNGVAVCWGNQRIQLIEAVRVLVGILVQIFAASTTISLIHNMSPKRSS